MAVGLGRAEEVEQGALSRVRRGLKMPEARARYADSRRWVCHPICLVYMRLQVEMMG